MKIIFSFCFLILSVTPITEIYSIEEENPEIVIMQISQKVEKTIEQMEGKESFERVMVDFAEIISELNMFEIRFQIQPEQAENWERVEKLAQKNLDLFKVLSHSSLYINKDSMSTAYTALLDLSGEKELAIAELDNIQPGGMCGNWASTVLMSVARQKSGLFQRMGNYKDALIEMENALSHRELVLYLPSEDILFTRYGFLLLKNQQFIKSMEIFQKVVFLFPGTSGEKVSKKYLIENEYKIELNSQVIMDKYFNNGNFRDKELVIFALAKHKFQDSLDVLLVLLEELNETFRNRIIPAIGELGDKRAIPELIKFLKSSESEVNCSYALKSLHQLGNDGQIIPYLQRILMRKDWVYLSFLDNILRTIFGDGPGLNKKDWKKNKNFAEKWLVWIEENYELQKKAQPGSKNRVQQVLIIQSEKG